MKLCDYGCGKEAKYQFKNGRWCCSESHNSCLSIKNKRDYKGSNNPMFDKKHSEETLDKISKKLLVVMNLPKVKQKISKGKKGKASWSKGLTKYNDPRMKKLSESLIKTLKKKYPEKPPNFCKKCNKPISHYSELCRSCSVKKGKKRWPKKFDNYSNLLCGYGCGQIAKYKFKNGNVVCSMGQQCPELRRKSRLRAINNRYNSYPNYNKDGCRVIEEYGKKFEYDFQHAENGGEYFIKELGYWLDGYDKKNNIVIEVDEKHHFNIDGNLSMKDIKRQQEIEHFLKCKFIRIKLK